MKNKKILVGIDIQGSFGNKDGELSVNGALLAADTLVKKIKKGGYSEIILTADWHPTNHVSFTVNGGEWPVHCLQHSVGAAILPNVLDAIEESGIKYTIMTKGDDPSKEEYSILQNEKNGAKFLEKVMNATSIDIAGVAGDYCVKETVLDMIKNGVDASKITILYDCIASIDDGTTLNELICKYNLNNE